MLSVGLIRVISLKSKEEQEVHARLMTRSYPSLKVFTEAIEGFPDGLLAVLHQLAGNREVAPGG